MPTAQSILGPKGQEVTVVEVGDTAAVAAQRMSEHHIGALVVVDGEKAVGIVSERDILTKVVASGLKPEATRADAIMTSPMTCCRRDTPVAECRAVMSEKGIRHLPVVEDGQLFGIISARDVMASGAKTMAETIKDLERTIGDVHEYLYTKT
jgi:CBS domain-containing protein